MSLARVWVHRRHADYPDVQTGMRFVKEEIAQVLIADECAQDWQTDMRRLLPEDPGREPQKGRRKPGRPRKIRESTPVSENGEIEPSRADVEEAPRYRRRDMRAEK